MCIRDRNQLVQFARGERRVVVGQKDAEAGRGNRQLLVDVAVSYTHLRAHETVLDLVCRLLLEKKQQLCLLRVCSLIAV